MTRAMQLIALGKAAAAVAGVGCPPERVRAALRLYGLVERVCAIDANGLMIWRRPGGEEWAMLSDWTGDVTGPSLDRATKKATRRLGHA